MFDPLSLIVGYLASREERKSQVHSSFDEYEDMDTDEWYREIYLTQEPLDKLRKEFIKDGFDASKLSREELIELNDRIDAGEDLYEERTVSSLRKECDERKVLYKHNYDKDKLVDILEKKDIEDTAEFIRTAPVKEVREFIGDLGIETNGMSRDELLEVWEKYGDENLYEKMTIDALRDECDEREVKYNSKMDKAKLIELLERQDELDDA